MPKYCQEGQSPDAVRVYTNGHDIYFWDTPESIRLAKDSWVSDKERFGEVTLLRQSERPMSRELINHEISSRPYQIEAIRTVWKGIDEAKESFAGYGHRYR